MSVHNPSPRPEVSILISQVGYDPMAQKRAFLRSTMEKPTFLNGTTDFMITKADTGTTIHVGEISFYGSKWLTWWWEMDFSQVAKPGTYRLEIAGGESQSQRLESTLFEIADGILVRDLAIIALDQLDDRILEGYKGWRDCGSEIHEVSSHVITVHGLIDLYDRREELLDEDQHRRLVDAIVWGTDYIVDCQEHSDDPLIDGRFNHDIVPFRGTHCYYNWHDTAYCVTALARASMMFQKIRSGVSDRYLRAAERAYKNALARPYHLDIDFAGGPGNASDEDQTPVVHHLARLTYDKPEDWILPSTLRTKSKLTFLWACMLLYQATEESQYLEEAIRWADIAAERQFLDWKNPIDGCYGNFYEFEEDNNTFLSEWNQDGRWHMGYIEPTNVRGFLDLIDTCLNHENTARWHNVVLTYIEHYVKPSARLNPLGIYPLNCYGKESEDGICFFKRTNHGATALYCQIAKNLLELAGYFHDDSLETLAHNNAQFVVGLNPGFPDHFEETSWVPT